MKIPRQDPIPQDPQPKPRPQDPPQFRTATYRARWEQDQQRDREFASVLDAAAQADPAVEAERQQIARQLGKRPEEIPNDLEVARGVLRKRAADYYDLSRRYPGTFERMQDVNFVRMAKDDVGNLKTHEGTLDWLARNFEAGDLANERGWIGLRRALGKGDQTDDSRLLEVDQLMRESAHEKGFVADATQILGQMAGTMPVSMGIGAGTSALAGPGAPLAFPIASGAATFTLSGAIQMGNAYLDMRERGIPHEIAYQSAILSGAAEGSLETLSQLVGLGPFKGAIGKFAARAGATTLAKETAGKAMGRFVLAYAKTYAAELGTELTQTTASNLIQQRAAAQANAAAPGTVKPGTPLGAELADTLEKVGKGMALLSLPGPGLELLSGMRKAQRSAAQVRALEDLAQAGERSQLKKLAPDEYAKTLNVQGEKAGVGTVYVDAGEFQAALRQADKAEVSEIASKSGLGEEAAAQIAPKASAELARKIPAVFESLRHSAVDVAIPIGDYQAHIEGTAFGDMLRPHRRFDRDGFSPAEAETFAKETRQMLLDKMDEQQTVAEARAKAEARIRDAKFAEIKAAAKQAGAPIQDAEARAGAEIHAAMVSSLAERSGMDPEEFAAKKYPLRVEAMQGASQSGAEGGTKVGTKVGTTDFPTDPAKSGEMRRPPDSAAGRARPLQQDSNEEPSPDGSGTSGRPSRAEFRGRIAEKSLAAALGKKADASSFVHESAHYYLTILGDLAASLDPSPALVADMDALLKWFGVKDLATWNEMTLDQQRKHHEAFAANFEVYLSEGKAPSVELQGVFDRFRVWLMRIYHAVRSRLNAAHRAEFGEDLPILTDEVRAVFDRMLASDEQVRQAQAIRSITPLFQTQKEAGMTDEEWLAYQEMHREQVDQAMTDRARDTLKATQWAFAATAEKRRELKAAEKAQRDKLRDGVAREVQMQPVYRVLRWLKKGETAVGDGMGGTFEKVEGVHKLSRQSVRAILGLPADFDENAKAFDEPKPQEAPRPVRETREERAIRLAAEADMAAQDAAAKKSANAAEAQRRRDEAASPAGRSFAKLRGLLSDDEAALPADVLAEQFGFRTGEQMVQSILEADPLKDAIDTALDERMLAEHPELSDPKAIQRSIAAAISNDARSRFVAAELRAATKATQPVRVMLAAAKEAARQQLAAMPVGEIDPRTFAVQESRAAVAARKALAAGDIAAQIEAQRKQLVANQMVRLAADAREEVDKARRGFERVFGDDEQTAKRRNMDVVQAARAVLGEHGIGPAARVEKATAYLARVRTYDPELHAELAPLVEEATATAQPWEQMSLEAFRVMQNTVEALWYRAKRSNEIEVDGRKVLRKDAVAQMVEAMRKQLGDAPVRRSATSETERESTLWAGALAKLRRVEHWAVRMDGGKAHGPVWTYIFRPVRERYDGYMAARETLVERLLGELRKVGELSPEKIDGGSDLNGFVFANQAELLGALLHSGNESNLRKLLLGYEMVPQQDDGTIDVSPWWSFVDRMVREGKLTRAHFEFVQAVWDINNDTLKPQAQKVNRDVYGQYFEEIQAQPFRVQIDGESVEFKGGYMPAKPDPLRNPDLRVREGLDGIMDGERNMRAALTPATSRGFTKARTEATRPLVLDVKLATQHIDEVLRFVHMQPAVRDVVSLLRDRDFAGYLNSVDPTAIKSMLIPWLTDTADNRTQKGGDGLLDRFLTALRRNTGLAFMFGSVRNALQQAAGISNASVYVQGKYLRSALWKHASAPRETAERVAGLSRFMNLRLESQIGQLHDDIGQILDTSVRGKVQAWTNRHGYFLQRAVQNRVDIITWMGAFDQAMAGRGDEDAVAVKKAVAEADSIVRRSQGSTTPADTAAYERGTALARAFTQFSGYWNLVLNQILGEAPGSARAKAALRAFIVPTLAASAIAAAVAAASGDDLDDWKDDFDNYSAWEIGKKFGVDLVRGGAGMAPAIGPLLAQGITRESRDRIAAAPLFSFFEVARRVVRAPLEDDPQSFDAQERRDARRARDVVTFFAMSTGLPVGPLATPASWLVDDR